MRHHLWERHPTVRTGDQLTLGERAADRMRLGMGSWPFVFGALVFLGLWMASKGLGVDEPPYILLNLVLSCLAALQGAILLISAKRADQISSEVAMHTLDNTAAQRDQLEANTALTAMVRDLAAAIKGDTALVDEVHRHVTAITDHLGIDAGRFRPSNEDPAST